jgi:hypothetical protein
MNKTKNIKNKICVVIYDDAAYSTRDTNPRKSPRQTISVGKIRRVNDDFIDLVFYKSKKALTRGVIIPLKAVVSCEELVHTS